MLQKEDKEGRLILSKKRAQYERAWGRIEEVMQSGQTIKGPVIEVVKGGLILDIGLRGFLPASLVDLRRVRDLQPFVGQRARGEDHRARPQPEQRRAVASRIPRGVAERGPQEVPREPPEERAAQGDGQLDRQLRRVRRPRRCRRSRPRVRTVVEARRPSERGRRASGRRSRSRCSTSISSVSASRCPSRPRRKTPGRSSSAPRRPARSSTDRSPSSCRSVRSFASRRASRASCTSPRSRTSTSTRPSRCCRSAMRSRSK